MLDRFIEAMDEHLSQYGVITNVVLRTERSLLEEAETNEIEMYFAATAEETSGPLAVIHLFPLGEEGVCEIEVEISFTAGAEEAAAIWQQAKKVVEEISLTEKRRYISPERLVESQVVLDYHFIVSLPASVEEEERFHQTWARFAKDLGQLVSL